MLQRESRTVEYKRELPDLRKIAQTVVAFSNGIGGQIIIGVEDRSRKIVGLSSRVVDDILERLPVSLADQIRPPLIPQVFPRNVDDKELVIVQVHPGGQKPYFMAQEGAKRGVYIRVGSHTRRADGELLEELRLLRSNMSYDEALITDCSHTNLDLSILPKNLRQEKLLLSLDLVRYSPHSGESYPTRGGVLMLCRSPERYVPEAEIIVSRMRGGSGRNTLESHVVNGALPQQIEIAFNYVIEWLAIEPRLKGVKYRAKQWRLPPEALREVIINAVLHRQYSIAGAIKIALFADRLEIFSPGHFSGPFVPEALGDGSSYIRNRVLCSVARRLGLIEKRGTGLRLIRDSMEQAGLQAPSFIEGPNWFKVTLSLEQRAPAQQQTNAPSQILALFERKTEISSSDVVESLKVSKATAVSYLEQLIAAGEVIRVGRGPKTRYRPR